MKLKLFGGGTNVTNLRIVAGGYDQETSRITFAVIGDDGRAGVLLLDGGDSKILAEGIASAPIAERVEAAPAGTAPSVLRGALRGAGTPSQPETPEPHP